ncbi:MAG: PepSY-associated TM helix domain-containing protein [Steroidobacteraceae bacterium]
MCLTGAILWWPGKARWRRSLTLHRGVSARQFVWDLHSVLGFWLLLLVFMWSVTGIYFAFPDAFNVFTDDTIASLVRLHFGRTYGPGVRCCGWCWVWRPAACSLPAH